MAVLVAACLCFLGAHAMQVPKSAHLPPEEHGALGQDCMSSLHLVPGQFTHTGTRIRLLGSFKFRFGGDCSFTLPKVHTYHPTLNWNVNQFQFCWWQGGSSEKLHAPLALAHTTCPALLLEQEQHAPCRQTNYTSPTLPTRPDQAQACICTMSPPA